MTTTTHIAAPPPFRKDSGFFNRHLPAVGYSKAQIHPSVNRIDNVSPLRYTSRTLWKGGKILKNSSRTTERSIEDGAAFRKRERRRQLIGIGLGIGVGMILSIFFPAIVQSIGLIETLLWSGAIGGVLGSLASFERAGAALTRSDNRFVNLALSLGIVIAFFALVLLLLRN